MQKKWTVLIGSIAVFMVIVYGGFIALLLSGRAGTPGSSDTIALIRLEGVISDSNTLGALETSGVETEDLISQLRDADADPAVKAILLRINSPGGTVAASQEIYRELMRVSKPVVSSIGDIGASGAYYIASASDRIMAAPSSAVGSIGVIMEVPNLAGLLKKIGVDYVVVTSGKYKDIGNPARKLSDEEIEILQGQSESAYRIFIKDVAKGRDVDVAKVEQWADGLTYPGEEARKKGMIDAIGNYQDAVQLAADLGKIKGEPQVQEFAEPTILDMLSGLWSVQARTIKEGLVSGLYESLLGQNHLQVN